jgi:ceramide glucosyltransferase
VLAWAIRALVARGLDRALGLAFSTPVWLLPARELISVGVMIASYAGREVEWRGYRLQAEGLNPR